MRNAIHLSLKRCSAEPGGSARKENSLIADKLIVFSVPLRPYQYRQYRILALVFL
jgi:hypothetical protein